MRFRDVHEERLTHRLEAFSDVVLGFSLAQTSLNFVIPHRAVQVYSDPTALIAFAFTFFVVSTTWYAHHRLFDYFFVPRVPTITLNFTMLGSVAWLVYQLQVYARFARTPDHRFAATSYIATFALAWMLLALLYVLCVRIRWSDLDVQERREGILQIGRIGSIGAGTAVTITLLTVLRLPAEIAFWLIPAWGAAWRAVSRPLLARVT